MSFPILPALRKIFIFSIILLIGLFFSKKNAFAADFIPSSSVSYTISENGSTHVLIQTTLTNNQNDSYASYYDLKVGFQTISNLNASDQTGSLLPILQKNQDGNTIKINFNAKVVGKGKQLPFTISFDTDAVATHLKDIWEINIPAVTKIDRFKSFDVLVIVPPSFGKPSFIKPASGKENGTFFYFSKQDLGNSGISMSFGDKQEYSYILTYHLQNSTIVPVHTEIALPPTTNYQDVSIDSIEPKPKDVLVDEDGNWLAQYNMLPEEKKLIRVKGFVSLYLKPNPVLLSENLRKKFLSQTKFWNTNDSAIKTLARSLNSPRAIYEYVVKSLTYDFSRVPKNEPRLGGNEALKNKKSAVCLEFTDLFISLARSAGIPAREVDGFAYTDNPTQRPLSLVKDILHSWPEYYDDSQKTWVMVDPTWGNTTSGLDYFSTLDLDHFTFVKKGIDPLYPIPAGGYKFQGAENEKDVLISFSKISGESNGGAYDASDNFPRSAIAGLPIIGSVTIQNRGTKVMRAQTVVIASKDLAPQNQSIPLEDIPPYGMKTFSFWFHPTSFLTNTKVLFTITLADKTLFHILSIQPITQTGWLLIGGVFVGTICAVIFVITRKSRHLHFFR